MTKTKKIQLEENLIDFSSSQKDASGAETSAIDQQVALQKMQALWQERPLRMGVYAATPSKGFPDRE